MIQHPIFKSIFLKISLALLACFVLNILIKSYMFGQYTNYAWESWLSGVTAIYVDNWLQEGASELNFAMVRTFDSVEMRNLNDREVYASFLPGCLFIPYFFAKIFSLKPSLIFVEAIACLFHFAGAILSSLISFLLCKKLELSEKKTFLFPFFTGFAYIFGYLNFKILSFGYFSDTAIYIYFLLFLLTEFCKKDSSRLILKGIIIFVGFCNEWFFASIVVVSFLNEIYRKEKKSIWNIIIAHFLPTFLALGLYLYYLDILDKLDHSIHRLLRRSIMNPVSGSKFENNFKTLLAEFFQKHIFVTLPTCIILFWNNFESKYFNKSNQFKNILLIAFYSGIVQIVVALQHSAEHYFSGIKLLIPLCIFVPFFLDEFSKIFPKRFQKNIIYGLIFLIFIGNLYMNYLIVSDWRKEHAIYDQLEKSFEKYGYDDLFFSYNLEILLDKYPKTDIKTTIQKEILPFDRVEGEPYLYLASRKQVYIIEEPQDILKMIKNRNLLGKAKVHLVFYHQFCHNFEKTFPNRIRKEGLLYFMDITDEELQSEDFISKFACKSNLYRYGYFATDSKKKKN